MTKDDYLNMNDKDFNIHRYSGDVKRTFDLLPARAKEMALIDLDMFGDWAGWNTLFTLRTMQSPIEIIFSLAFELSQPNDDKTPFIYLNPQEEIICNEKRYVADFVFDSKIQPFDYYTSFNKKLVIECDGYEFHERTKEQVKRDNEREYDLKMAGYDVLRFSGSEIYNTPYACAEKTINYIKKIIAEEQQKETL